MMDMRHAMIACVTTSVLLLYNDLSPLLAAIVAMVAIIIRRTTVVEGLVSSGTDQTEIIADADDVSDLKSISSQLLFALEEDRSASGEIKVVFSSSSEEKDKFRKSDQSAANSPKWTGPSSETMLKGDALSIFITTTPPTNAETDETNLPIELFLATGNESAESSDKLDVRLYIQDNELHAVYAEDKVSVTYPLQTATRTHYMTRSADGVRVGYFEPFSGAHAENVGAISADKGIVNTNSASCVINANVHAIGQIRSAIAFHADVLKANGQTSILNCKKVISERIYKQCSVYKSLEAQLGECNKSSSPTIKGDDVKNLCDENWSPMTIHKQSDKCRAAIFNSCSNDPSQEGCECWDKASADYSTTQCEKLRSLYGYNSETQSNESSQVVDIKPVVEEQVQERVYLKPPTMFEYLTPI